MLLTPQSLSRIAPNLDAAKAATYSGILNKATGEFGIDTPLRMAYFLGQLMVESGNLTAFREGMNYRAERLMEVWPTRFPTMDLARQYERDPRKLANCVYANRMGNGGPETDEGWLHRGAGWIQLTGKTNQLACADHFNIPGKEVGDWLATVKGAAESAAWFWWKNSCNRFADTDNVDAVSDAINLGRQTQKVGDAEGYAKRKAMTNLCKQTLGVK